MQSNQSPVLIPEYSAEKKPSVPWGFWATIGFGLVIGFTYLIGQILVEGIFAINSVISHPGESITQLTNILSNGNALAVTIFVSTIIGAGFTLLFIKMRKGISIKEYLALQPIKLTTVFSVLAIAVALLFISGFLLAGLQQTKFTNEVAQAYKSSSVLVLIAAAIFSPIFEELFFRGFLFAGFQGSKLGVQGAILLTAALWALSHATQYSILALLVIFGVGVVFGIARWRTKSLYASLAMHFVWNLFSLVVSMIYIQGRIS
jgi:hypothetical protein